MQKMVKWKDLWGARCDYDVVGRREKKWGRKVILDFRKSRMADDAISCAKL